MSLESLILYIVWSMTILSLFIIPAHMWREASISFLFQHFFTWFLGILVVEWNMIIYPVRLLASVNSTSFTFEFFVYPVIGIFFNLYYPLKKTFFHRFIYIFAITSAITITEIMLEIYTDTIEYVNWHWYDTWLSVFLTLVFLRVFFIWFFQINEKLIIKE